MIRKIRLFTGTPKQVEKEVNDFLVGLASDCEVLQLIQSESMAPLSEDSKIFRMVTITVVYQAPA